MDNKKQVEDSDILPFPKIMWSRIEGSTESPRSGCYRLLLLYTLRESATCTTPRLRESSVIAAAVLYHTR